MNRRTWLLLLVLTAGAALVWLGYRYLSLDTLAQHENQLRQWVNGAPVAAIAIGFAVYLAAALVPGTAGKAIVYGWVFGFWAALVIVNVALTLAAIVVCLAVRYFLRDAVRSKLAARMDRVDDAVARDGAFYFLTLRLLRVPYSLTNFCAAATQLPLRSFWWTTQVGLIPSNVTFVLLGSQLPSLSELAERGVLSLIDPGLFIALSATALIPVAVRTFVRTGLRRLDVPPEDLEATTDALDSKAT